MKPATLFSYIFLVGSFFLACYVSYSAGYGTGSKKLPPRILLSLPSNRVEAEKALADALRDRFSYETPEAKVIENLKDDGFAIGYDEKAQRSFAMYVSLFENTSKVRCHGYVLIDWDLTRENKVKEFHVSQPVQCGSIFSRPPLPN